MYTHIQKNRRAVWLFSFAAGLLGLIVGTTLSGPVLADAFHAQRPPTFWDVLIPNLFVLLPYAFVPALLVLLIVWVIQAKNGSQKKSRRQD